MKYFQSTDNGFTLVETLVAITILMIVIIGPLTISSSAARSTSFSSEQVIAFFLAQEGVEIAQKARDDLFLTNFTTPTIGWTAFSDSSGSGVYNNCYKATGCGLELNTNVTASLKPPKDCATNCVLYYNATGQRSRYTHVASGASVTPYTRTIYFQVINTREVKVVSTVTWRAGSQRAAQSVSVETYLLNIYGN